MSTTIKLKSGITDPPENALQQRELGVNTQTDELFIGTYSGRAKAIASVPYVQTLLMGYVKPTEISHTSNVCTLLLSESFCGLAIIQLQHNTIPFYLYVEEGQVKNQCMVEHTQADSVQFTAQAMQLTIQSDNGFTLQIIPLTGSFQINE